MPNLSFCILISDHCTCVGAVYALLTWDDIVFCLETNTLTITITKYTITITIT